MTTHLAVHVNGIRWFIEKKDSQEATRCLCVYIRNYGKIKDHKLSKIRMNYKNLHLEKPEPTSS